MGISSENYKGGLKEYWKKRTSKVRRGPPLSSAVLGSGADESSGSRGRRRFRLPRRVKFLSKIGTPRRWIKRLRDAYVSMMVRLASSAAVGYGSYGYGSYGDVGFAQPRVKEYDEKVLVEIYKKIIVAQGMAGAGAAESGRRIAI
ncbi:hypothetical protein LUZ60_003514 [Juncus effusus]|nr:hypothetical protein LUZ60_003514 [Juncus effusus]